MAGKVKRKNSKSPKFIAECIKMVVEQGMTTVEVAKIKNIGNSTVGAYMTSYRKNNNLIKMDDEQDQSSEINLPENTSKVLNTKIKILIKRVEILESEKKVLKKTIAIFMKDD